MTHQSGCWKTLLCWLLKQSRSVGNSFQAFCTVLLHECPAWCMLCPGQLYAHRQSLLISCTLGPACKLYKTQYIHVQGGICNIMSVWL